MSHRLYFPPHVLELNKLILHELFELLLHCITSNNHHHQGYVININVSFETCLWLLLPHFPRTCHRRALQRFTVFHFGVTYCYLYQRSVSTTLPKSRASYSNTIKWPFPTLSALCSNSVSWGHWSSDCRAFMVVSCCSVQKEGGHQIREEFLD